MRENDIARDRRTDWGKESLGIVSCVDIPWHR